MQTPLNGNLANPMVRAGSTRVHLVLPHEERTWCRRFRITDGQWFLYTGTYNPLPYCQLCLRRKKHHDAKTPGR